MFRLRSCASSTINASYASSLRSVRISFSRMPSVMTFTRVRGPVRSVNRTVRPTVSPIGTSSSAASRVAAACAAMRRGCV